VTILVVLAACSPSSGSGPATASADPSVGKYDQTWAKPYKATTCGDWRKKMDSHQQFVMAGDILLSARKSDGDDSLPPDAMIRDFAGNIGVACRGAGVKLGIKIPEVAASLYVMSRDYKP
jgi:hypothetical protein